MDASVEMASMNRMEGSTTESIKSSASKATTSTANANGAAGGLGGLSVGREKSKSKERIGMLTPDKLKSPLVGKKIKDKEEREALRQIEIRKEMNRDIAMAVMIAALTPPRTKRQISSSVKVSLVPEDELSEHQCSAQLSFSETPETRRKSNATLNITTSLNTTMSGTPETSRKGYGSYEILNSLPREVLCPPEDPTPPASNLIWAALAFLLCPWMACCGVSAIKAARECRRQTAEGNLKDARHHGERAKLCAGITFFVGAAILLIGIGFVANVMKK